MRKRLRPRCRAYSCIRPAAIDVNVERFHEIRDDVFDADRLCRLLHPARGDHHRQLLDESADHLERQTAGAENDGRPKLDRGHAGRAEDVADFMATCKMDREVRARAQPAEIHDAADTRGARSVCKVLRTEAVLLDEGVG
jgi:hypothetical protein